MNSVLRQFHIRLAGIKAFRIRQGGSRVWGTYRSPVETSHVRHVVSDGPAGCQFPLNRGRDGHCGTECRKHVQQTDLMQRQQRIEAAKATA